MGGSVTLGGGSSSAETLSWRAILRQYLADNPTPARYFPYGKQINSGVNGTPSWYGLVRLQTDVIDYAPELVTLDSAVNDVSMGVGFGDRPNGFFPAAEALIRRLRTALPNASIYVWIFTWPNDYSFTAVRSDARDLWVTLANHYNLTLLRLDQYLETLMPASYVDADVEVYYGHNDVHPNNAGHAAAGALAISMVPSLAVPSGALPARYFAESEDYESTPIIRNAIDNDAETGTWATVSTTARQSTVADSTISWTGTFCSFGLDISSGTATWSVDGGSENAIQFVGGVTTLWNFTRGIHTIRIKVVSGTVKINRFLAV